MTGLKPLHGDGVIFLLMDQLAENYDTAAEGAFTLSERERERANFL